jgi:hypothetical protein
MEYKLFVNAFLEDLLSSVELKIRNTEQLRSEFFICNYIYKRIFNFACVLLNIRHIKNRCFKLNLQTYI